MEFAISVTTKEALIELLRNVTNMALVHADDGDSFEFEYEVLAFYELDGRIRALVDELEIARRIESRRAA